MRAQQIAYLYPRFFKRFSVQFQPATFYFVKSIGVKPLNADVYAFYARLRASLNKRKQRRFFIRHNVQACVIMFVVGDFFCMGWGIYAPLSSLAVCINPGSAFNCYWTMPFRKKCKITIENMDEEKAMNLYYQVDYTLTDVPEDAAYFHAQWRRTNPNHTSDYTIVDNIKGKGHFVGTYLAWGVNNNGWWGEGEIKFFMDGDKKFPTICGTGTEDYFCGSYNFDRGGQYKEFCTPYAGLHQVIRPDGTYNSQQRFGLYRWHITDPIRFEKDLKVTIQDLGWRAGGRYLPQKSDIASVAFWYQAEPHNKFPEMVSWEELEVN